MQQKVKLMKKQAEEGQSQEAEDMDLELMNLIFKRSVYCSQTTQHHTNHLAFNQHHRCVRPDRRKCLYWLYLSISQWNELKFCMIVI